MPDMKRLKPVSLGEDVTIEGVQYQQDRDINPNAPVENITDWTLMLFARIHASDQGPFLFTAGPAALDDPTNGAYHIVIPSATLIAANVEGDIVIAIWRTDSGESTNVFEAILPIKAGVRFSVTP